MKKKTSLSRLVSGLFFMGVLLTTILAGDTEKGDDPGKETKDGSTALVKKEDSAYTIGPRSRDGIGKFYMGREISFVMGHQAIGWLERGTREQEEKPSKLIANLELKSDDVIGDIGAGSGFFTFRLAPKVPKGRVYAVDIQKEMIAHLEKKKKELGLKNVETVHSTIEDTKLPEGKVDAVLLVDAYHEFSHPKEMMASIFKALRSGGRVYLIEYRTEDPSVPIKPLHKMSQAQAKKEMSASGFKWKETRDFLPWQHFMVFVKP